MLTTATERSSSAVRSVYPDATFAGMVGLAVQEFTRDMRFAWKGEECHRGHGLNALNFKQSNDSARLHVKFHSFDAVTHLLLYSFGTEGSPLGCAKKGQEIRFGGEMRVDRRPSTHGVPQVDHAIPQIEVPAYQVSEGLFAVKIPDEFLKVEIPVAVQQTTLDQWIADNPGRCIKRGDLAHLLKEDDSKSAFQRATSQIKAFARQYPDVLYQIDRGPHKHVFVATFPTNEGGN